MENLNKLAAILKSQLKVQRELLDIERNKTDILVKGDIDRLNELINTEQALLMTGGNLEKQREALSESTGIKDLTLNELILKYDSENKFGLKTVYEELKEVLFMLKRTGALNAKLLNSRMQTVRYMSGKLRDLTGDVIDETSVTYKKIK